MPLGQRRTGRPAAALVKQHAGCQPAGLPACASSAIIGWSCLATRLSLAQPCDVRSRAWPGGTGAGSSTSSCNPPTIVADDDPCLPPHPLHTLTLVCPGRVACLAAVEAMHSGHGAAQSASAAATGSKAAQGSDKAPAAAASRPRAWSAARASRRRLHPRLPNAALHGSRFASLPEHEGVRRRQASRRLAQRPLRSCRSTPLPQPIPALQS